MIDDKSWMLSYAYEKGVVFLKRQACDSARTSRVYRVENVLYNTAYFRTLTFAACCYITYNLVSLCEDQNRLTCPLCTRRLVLSSMLLYSTQ